MKKTAIFVGILLFVIGTIIIVPAMGEHAIVSENGKYVVLFEQKTAVKLENGTPINEKVFQFYKSIYLKHRNHIVWDEKRLDNNITAYYDRKQVKCTGECMIPVSANNVQFHIDGVAFHISNERYYDDYAIATVIILETLLAGLSSFIALLIDEFC